MNESRRMPDSHSPGDVSDLRCCAWSGPNREQGVAQRRLSNVPDLDGTGVVTFTNGAVSSSTNIVIYAFRRISFLVLDVQSADPDVGWAR